MSLKGKRAAVKQEPMFLSRFALRVFRFGIVHHNGIVDFDDDAFAFYFYIFSVPFIVLGIIFLYVHDIVEASGPVSNLYANY